MLLLVMPMASHTRAGDEEPGIKYPNLKIGGFGDFNYFDSDEESPDAASGFFQGQFVLHFVSALSSQFTFFGEVSWTAVNSSYKTAVERAIISYERSDYLKISGGRFHTPINWWNVAFHHGQWLQTSISRPEMTRFGGEFIPVHFVGMIVGGDVPSGSMNLSYQAGVGNGRGDNIAGAGDGGG